MAWLVGGRESEYTLAFMDNLPSRLASHAQLMSDVQRAYLEAVEDAFGGDVDYAILQKIYAPFSKWQRTATAFEVLRFGDAASK